jgi:hypothetical protein
MKVLETLELSGESDTILSASGFSLGEIESFLTDPAV